MSPLTLIIVYCALILVASLLGGWIPLIVRLTHRRMEVATSLIAGIMLGIGLLHLLPHALLEVRSAGGGIDDIMIWVLAGFLVMFLIERFLSFHSHDLPTESQAEQADPHTREETDPQHASCDHQHPDPKHHHQMTWSGAALGLTIHSVIAGALLAAGVEAGTGHGSSGLAGLGIFLVIVLHKPFDSMTLGTLMAKGGWPSSWRHSVNCLFALAIPVGALLFHFGISPDHGSMELGYALAFAAGTFLCISMSDLLPELQFHNHDRVLLTAALLLGLAVSYVVGKFEGQAHGHSPPVQQQTGPEAAKQRQQRTGPTESPSQ